ncbi:hypothetical protein HYDPIDRAFT_111678 [Hydnomerulius pinastri MD-312]|uniref:WD40 repeat-like protein n=1 Tax=Hydnomerulius pinastri MD-312 TaxID=994086 RepID=A0A0C9WG81_9AGAM|nr:hypothetical protein HYDPIDRAFT_111678 [Hydnomerulius pinastri MD-312]
MSTPSTSVDASSSSYPVASKSESRPAPIQTYEGHEDSVLYVAFFQDEQRLVTGSADGSLRVWNRETGAQIGKTLQGHTGPVNEVDVSPDGRTIASGSDDGTVKIWDAETEELLQTLGHGDRVTSVHISPDSKRVASGSVDRRLRIWDIKTGELALEPIICMGMVWCVRYSPTGDRIASAADFIEIWDANTSDWEDSIIYIQEEAYPLAWTLDGEEVISGGDRIVAFWDSLIGEGTRSWEAHETWIYSVSLSRNGFHLATCSQFEKTAFVFDLRTRKRIAAYEHDDVVFTLAYSPSGRFITTACRDRKAHLWDAPGHPQATSQEPPCGSEAIAPESCSASPLQARHLTSIASPVGPPTSTSPPLSSSLDSVASVSTSIPTSGPPSAPVVTIPPPVEASTTYSLPPTSSPSIPLCLARVDLSDEGVSHVPTSPSECSSLPARVLPSSADFPPTSPNLGTRLSSSQDVDISFLPPDEASILREYRRQKSKFAAAHGAPSEPPHDVESIVSLSSLQTPVHHPPLDSLLHVRDASSLPHPSSLSPGGQPPSPFIRPISDADPVDAASPLSTSPAEHDLELDAHLSMSRPSDLCAGSRTDIEADSVPMLEFENPWASD